MCNFIKLITLKTVLVFIYFVQADNLSNSYAKVVTSGSSHEGSTNNHADTPKIYKSQLSSLDFLTSTTKATEQSLSAMAPDASAGRAYTYSDSYHGYSNGQRYKNYHRRPTIVYPQTRLSNRHYAMDRYTPGEAVATAQFKKNKEGYKYSPPKMKATRPSGVDYVPPKDLYAFPPNTDSNYLPPSKPYETAQRKPVSSYIPPPAGLPGLGFLGPVNPEYLPPTLQKSKPDKNNVVTASQKQPSMSDGLNDDMLPALSSDETSSSREKETDSVKNLATSDQTNDEVSKDMPEPDMPPDTDTMDMQSMLDKPPMMDGHSSSEMVIPSDSFHFPSDHYGAHGVDAYPEIIFDDHDHHHFHHDYHDHHPEIMMMTTTTMKPEPPPEPRVKKYSYFYLGRKLWYIPLYFTVWFSFYILWLIIKSIARHKVNLPNHYTGRMMKRQIPHMTANPKSLNYINNLSASILSSIEKFENNYLNTK